MSTALLTRNGSRRLDTFQCQKCDHPPFTTNAGLLMHDGRVHTGTIRAHRETNGKHTCPKCGKPFKNEAGVMIHMGRTHGKKVRPPKRYTERQLVERVLERHASPVPVSVSCPSCQFDFQPLLNKGKVPAKFCPGCAVPLQTLVDNLKALMCP